MWRVKGGKNITYTKLIIDGEVYTIGDVEIWRNQTIANKEEEGTKRTKEGKRTVSERSSSDGEILRNRRKRERDIT